MEEDSMVVEPKRWNPHRRTNLIKQSTRQRGICLIKCQPHAKRHIGGGTVVEKFWAFQIWVLQKMVLNLDVKLLYFRGALNN